MAHDPTSPRPDASERALAPGTDPTREPLSGRASRELDSGIPVGPTPPMDFWTALYGRRSVRRFKRDPVPRDLLEQVMHAGIWAPSSCNYQMWDLVVVDDAALNSELAALAAQMGDAPVNVVVAYGREFSELGSAHVQSASALLENMSLAAHVLGLGTFWITDIGDPERVRELVGLPRDRFVVAVLAIGWPVERRSAAPKRRPLSEVRHWNRYAGRPIPASADPALWTPDQLEVYQRARVLNGLRHNKPRAWEARAIDAMIERLAPREPAGSSNGAANAPRWLDVLPCTGIVTERLSRARPGFHFEVVERSSAVAEFVAARTTPRALTNLWPDAAEARAPRDGAYEVVSCLFRLEGLAPGDRPALARAMAQWVAPGGTVLVGFVQRPSFHAAAERWRERRGRLLGVEYVLAPDPNIGPFEALRAAEVERLFAQAGLLPSASFGCHVAPPLDEVGFRTRNLAAVARRFALALARVGSPLEHVPFATRAFGRFQFRRFVRPR